MSLPVQPIQDGPRTAYVFRLMGRQPAAAPLLYGPTGRPRFSTGARENRGGIGALLLKLRQPGAAPGSVDLQEALQLPNTCSSAEGLAWLVGAQLERVRRNAQPEQHTYYFSQGGKKFHASRDCSGLNNGRRECAFQSAAPAGMKPGQGIKQIDSWLGRKPQGSLAGYMW